MSIKMKYNSALIVTAVFCLISCQDKTDEKSTSEVYNQQNEPKQNMNPSGNEVIMQSKLTVEKARNLTPILDPKFEQSMQKNMAKLEESNALLSNGLMTHITENDDNINSQDYVTTKSDKNTNSTELDAVEQAIQAAAPALENITEN